jgi:hypothetical protein
VDYRGHGFQDYNDALDKLQTLLKRHTATRKCLVEVKGKAGNQEHYGTLAKLPCYGRWDEGRLQDFMDTPVHPFSWLQERIDRLELRLAEKPVPEAPAPRGRVKVGSHTGTNVPAHALARLPDMVRQYKDHAFYLYARHVTPRRNDVRLAVRDFEITLAVLSLVKRYVKNGKQTPQKFVKAVWQTAYKDEYVERAFCDSRWSAIWQTLADCQFIDVESDQYWFDPNGEERGQCMRWELKEQFCARDDREATGGEGTVIATGVPPYAPSVYRPTRVAPPSANVWTPEKEAEVERILCFWT